MKRKGFLRSYHILKSFHSKNIWTLLKAFKVFVIPILEYGSTLWNPYNKSDIYSVESVQRSFTKQVCLRCNIPFKSYTDRLQKLGLRSLEYRRLESDVTMVYKIIHGFVDLPFENLFKFYESPYNTRRHKYSLKLPMHNCQVYKYSFATRVVLVWNNLPENLVSISTLPVFIRSLKKFNLCTIYDFIIK